jgi:type 1 glutamine amidotransferase
MNKLQRIYIPTLGRVDKQITYSNMPDWVKDITYFVIQPHEEEIFRKTYPNSNIKVLPLKIKGIARTREWIINDGGDACYAVFDDDIKFTKRNVDRKTLKKNSDKSNEAFTEEHWKEMFTRIGEWFDEGVGLGGCFAKGSPPKEEDEKQFGKFIQVHFINGSKIFREELDWSLKWGEDIHFVLQILKRGVKTRLSDIYLVDSEEYYSDGGCMEEGRTVDKDIECLKELELIYPHIFSIVWNKHYTLNKIFKLPKIKVEWRRAYNPYYGRVVTNEWF